MKKYKITYWSKGNLKKKTVEAESVNHAKITLYLLHECDDIVSVEEVTSNV